jgi:murein DD-endopeptidase MepM/ murein hydrolase activator NlpD
VRGSISVSVCVLVTACWIIAAGATGIPEFAWPVVGDVSLAFAEYEDPLLGPALHPGIDIEAAPADVVRAAAAGTVVFVGALPPYDELVVIEHDDYLWTYYGHLFRVRVEVGEVVETGRIIGQVGQSSVTGEYACHFELRRGGLNVDPLAYLPPEPEPGSEP